MKIYNIGLLGYGHIGQAVAKAVDELTKTRPVRLVKIFDIPEMKDVAGERFVSSVDEIVEDPDIDIVIEALGGDTFPFESIKSALKRKKHVVTSNKTVVSQHLQELLKLAHMNGVYFQFEAACRVGLPTIKPLIELGKFDNIKSIFGFLNTSTNIVMSCIESRGMTLQEALDFAVEKRVTERDFQIDMMGLDLARKLSILASLAFKTPIDPVKVTCFGLTNLQDYMLNGVLKDYSLRLIGEARLVNNSVQIEVIPGIFNKVNKDPRLQLAGFSDSYIEIDAERCGLIKLSGTSFGSEGAGAAVSGDVIRIIESSGYIDNVDLRNYPILRYRDDSSTYLVFEGKKAKLIKGSEFKLDTKYEFIAKVFTEEFKL